MVFREDETLELKKSTAELDKAIVSIAAMLNKQGHGDLYFGIKNDGVVVGQQISENTIRKISQSINTRIDPRIFPQIKKVTIDNKTCVHVSFKGSDGPYYADGRAFVRVGDEDKKLSAKELENIIVKKNKEALRWDNRTSDYSLENVNEKVLKNYIDRAKKEGRLSFDFQDVETTMKKLKLVENNKLLKAAEILFCDQNQLKVQMAVFAGTERLTFLDIDDCEGNIFYLLKRTENYIKEHIDWRVQFGALQRKEIPEIPLEAIREALVNSFCHRDYTLPENNQVAIYKNRIEIYNPGSFPEGVTPEDYIKGDLPSLPRNPLIAEILYKSREIEQWGSGLKRIYENCSKQGITVEFKILKSGFMTVFYRPLKKDIQKYIKGDVKKDIEPTGEIEETSEPAPPTNIKRPSVTHRLIVYAIYGIIAGGIWGLMWGRVFQEAFSFTIALIYNIIAGAIIGPIIGFSRKMAIHLAIGYGIGVFFTFIGVLITMDIKGIAYALIFGPSIGTFLSMFVKILKEKGILV